MDSAETLRDRLLAMAEDRERWRNDPSGWFDRHAEEFYRRTGLIAPGKSVPLEMGAEQDEAERQQRWVEWRRDESDALNALLREAAARVPAGTETMDDAAEMLWVVVAKRGFVVQPSAVPPTPDKLLAIAGLTNSYVNDGTTLTAAETLQAIADVLGDPFEPQPSAVPASSWREISSAPKDGTRILLARKSVLSGELIVASGYWNSGGAMHMPHWGAATAMHDATLWMPLPNPPVSLGVGRQTTDD